MTIICKTILSLTLLSLYLAGAGQSSYTVIYRLKMNVDSTGKSNAPELYFARGKIVNSFLRSRKKIRF